MPNPFRSFKYLPWAVLLQSGALTVLVATALDILLIAAIALVPVGSIPSVPLTRTLLSLLGFVLPLAAYFGIGALAIAITAGFFRQILLSAETIWALIGCVLLVLLLKSWLAVVPSGLVGGLDYVGVMAIVLGAFTQGRRYWR